MRPHHHGMQRAVRHVFADAGSARIIHAHNNHGRHNAFANQAIAGFVDLPFDSGKGRRCLEQVLTVIQIKHRIVQAGVFWIVVAGRQPHAQESRVTENAAVEFVQAQISRRGLRADYAGSGSGNMAFCLLDFFHPEKCTTRIQRRSQFRLSQF